MPTSAGLVPCSDAAGIVEELGTDSVWKAGDRVILHPNTWLNGRDERGFDITKAFGAGTVAGTLTEYMVVGDERLIKVPEHLSLEEASVLPTAGSTACHSLFFVPEQPVGDGTWVLVQGTGGVSTIAIQVRDRMIMLWTRVDELFLASLQRQPVRLLLLPLVPTRSLRFRSS